MSDRGHEPERRYWATAPTSRDVGVESVIEAEADMTRTLDFVRL
jgi:hypothetical protein